MIIVLVSQFHVYLLWGQCPFSNSRFQLGEGPSRGLPSDYEPSDGPSFQALLRTRPSVMRYLSDVSVWSSSRLQRETRWKCWTRRIISSLQKWDLQTGWKMRQARIVIRTEVWSDVCLIFPERNPVKMLKSTLCQLLWVVSRHLI